MRSLLAEILSMTLQGLGELASGYLWSLSSPILSRHPSILIALPGLAEDRGAIYGSLAAKYSSMLYTGEATSPRDLLENKVTAVAVLLGLLGGLYVVLLTSFLGNPLDVLAYFLVSRGFTLTLVIPFNAYASFLAFVKGLNVDLVVVSTSTVLADITSSISILLTFTPFALIGIALMLVTTYKYSKNVGREDLLRYKELMVSSIIASTLSTIAGFVLVANEAQNNPTLLFITPLTMALNGSASMNFSSWLGTALLTGEVDSKELFRSKRVYEIMLRVTFTTLTALTLVLLPAITLANMDLRGLKWALLSTLTLRLVMPYLSMVVARIGFEKGLDPDLITIPLLSSLNDIVTAQALTTMAKLI
ncbi:hypothetical protein EYM_06360 [Ignicoccus islandicus DSM 13165]|uniref:SLC41A/MgtE integral membrane domain-containing protein n=1 Tax=Ignicoccus islandicus DSM 13165 TaxID=940295 RepID=A0A0U3DYM5_9CREN|nr:magnesium transporter [Ignicoccus islandicus]ALU12682.1 hypothetical protein EYM_06360 [Ignicoccus islandicus DSM 13165]